MLLPQCKLLALTVLLQLLTQQPQRLEQHASADFVMFLSLLLLSLLLLPLLLLLLMLLLLLLLPQLYVGVQLELLKPK